MLAELSHANMLKVIWLIMQPEDSWLTVNTISRKVQAVYDCINGSPQLTIEQTKMHGIGSNFLLQDRYKSIKSGIIGFFHRNNYDSYAILNMIFSMIWISEPELSEELFHHYVDIYQTCVTNHGYNSRLAVHLKMPSTLSFIERSRMRTRMHEDLWAREYRMLSIHSRLEKEVANFRAEVAEQLINNVKQQLTNLQQMLEEYPVV